jgi:MFS-type transporter involved in bile tolerance (Atg22 family)
MPLPLAVPQVGAAVSAHGLALSAASGRLWRWCCSSPASAHAARAMKYLSAYLLYNDGIQTVVVAPIFASQELGMCPPCSSWSS